MKRVAELAERRRRETSRDDRISVGAKSLRFGSEEPRCAEGNVPSNVAAEQRMMLAAGAEAQAWGADVAAGRAGGDIIEVWRWSKVFGLGERLPAATWGSSASKTEVLA
jgi:hypothetical protein